MLITAVEPRRRGMCALYIDGEYVMNLDAQTLLENSFRAGREIDDDELRRVIELSGERLAKEKALRLISYRDHSKKELYDKVKRVCDPSSAEKAVSRLEELGLADDGRFAQNYARQLIFTKRMSKRGARFELLRKGIDRELADEVLCQIEYDPKENIRAVINKKYRDISDEKIRRRAFAALSRLGYGRDDIRSVFNEYTEDDLI